MIAVTGRRIVWHGQLTSAFHTRRQGYANLWKCAPFILGSTWRGALLTALITTHYDNDAIQRQAFKTEGPAAAFFAAPPRAYFGFGHFPTPVEAQMTSQTRVTVERAQGSVTKGALLSVETVAAGTPFTADVLLPGNDDALARVVQTGIHAMAATTGLGSLQSVGLGQFTVTEVQEQPLQIEALPLAPATSVKLTFVTPYILADGQAPWDSAPEALGRRMTGELARLLADLAFSLRAPTIARVDVALQPDFVGRWSYEEGARLNRLAAWSGSVFTLTFDEPGDVTEALAIARAFGWGEWAEVGFGRFELDAA